jgi:putative FmdB family regulatory protein
LTCRGSLWSIRRSYSVNNRVRKIMPTYEYVCHKCGKEFELFQRMSEEPIKICPDQKCKGPVKRLIGVGAGIIFKGPGFYYTDYQRSVPPKAEESAGAASSSASSASSGSASSTSEKQSPQK